jgi:xanthine dehydrogenase accessory factor
MTPAPTDAFPPQAGVWRFVRERLKRRQRVMLLLVADSRGSAPGKAGFKMAVGADGQLCGTIGGGTIEHAAVEAARTQLRQARPQASVTLQVHQPEHPQTSGMVCGGRQTVVTYPCRPRDRAAVESVLQRLEAGPPGVLTLTARGLSVGPPRRKAAPFHFVQESGSWRFQEHFRAPDTVFIVGGGHVGLALSRVMATLGFRIVVFDERPDLNTLVSNTFAHEKQVLAFAHVGQAIPPGPQNYAVIMTPGYFSDEAALRQLVRKPLRYLGLMAIRGKARQILGKLRADGYPEELLTKVHTPVGLPLPSRTPAEIAISIAAQIIQVRNAPVTDSYG